MLQDISEGSRGLCFELVKDDHPLDLHEFEYCLSDNFVIHQEFFKGTKVSYDVIIKKQIDS